jgi:glycerate dehydrogenase
MMNSEDESPRIVFLDAATFGDISLKRFTDRWNCTVHQVTRPSETIGRLKHCTVAVTNKVPIRGDALTAPEASKLQLIAVAATGTDIIDLKAATASGVTVSNVPGYATQSVAQFTMALILEIATGAGRYSESVRKGEWEKSPVFSLLRYSTTEIAGKKLGIVGYGNIGRAVAQMAQSFGMEVLIAARPGSLKPQPNTHLSISQLLRQADVVSLHCPLTSQTKNLISEETLRSMKPTAILINTARGGLIDEAALLRALREKRLAAAALDVLSEEPPASDHPMIAASRQLDNLRITPHVAWSAREARERLMEEVAENIAAFFDGKARHVISYNSA